MSYVYQKYPLARYRNGEYMAVKNEAEQAEMDAQGWTDWNSDQAAMRGEKLAEPPSVSTASSVMTVDEWKEARSEVAKRKPGRPPKVK